MNCQLAAHRLEVGVPSTVEFASGGSKAAASQAKDVAQTVRTSSLYRCTYAFDQVHHFITLMDSLRLNVVAVDQVFLGMKELFECLNQISNVPADFPPRIKIRDWYLFSVDNIAY